MGRMKEIFMAQREAESDNLDYYNIEVYEPHQLCSNCGLPELHQVSPIDYFCGICATEFAETNGSLHTINNNEN